MQTYKIHICTHLDDLLAEYIAEWREFCLIAVFLWQCQVHIICCCLSFCGVHKFLVRLEKTMLKQRGLSGTWHTWIGSFTGPGKSFAWHRANLDQMVIPSWCLTDQMVIAGFATKTIPQGAPVPTEHFKNYHSALVVVSIWTSLVLLFFGSMGRGPFSTGKQSIRKICPCPATPCYKKPELLGWDPPPAPLNKHNRFQHGHRIWICTPGPSKAHILVSTPVIAFWCLADQMVIAGFATKTIPQGAPVPTEHFKNYHSALVVVSIWTSLVLLFFGSMGRGPFSMGKQSIRKICPCPATPCYKKPELLGWDPPRPPWISITDFNMDTESEFAPQDLVRPTS